MGNHRAQASKNSVAAKQVVKPSLSNVRRSLSGLPKNHLSKSIADTDDKQVAVSQASGFFDFGSISIFPKGKSPARLNSQALPIQAKLRIGQPNDKYEQEADRVADQVMRMPDPKIQQPSEADARYSGIKSDFSASNADGAVQRQQEKEEELIQAKPLAQQISPLIQRQPDEEDDEELIQAKTTGDVTPAVTPAISAGIQSLQGGGRPLSRLDRSFFEPRFGADFSGVRVHSDARAAGLARSVNARAFTHGQNVVFGAGEYSSGSLKERGLLAHELTHVVQQGGSNKIGFQTSIESDPIDSPLTSHVVQQSNRPNTNVIYRLGATTIGRAGSSDVAEPLDTESPAPDDSVADTPGAEDPITADIPDLGTEAELQAPLVEVDVAGVTLNNPKVTVPLIGTTAITATATPAGATNVTFSLAADSVAPASGTTIDASTGAITVAADQVGGTINVVAVSNNAAATGTASFPLRFVEVPTGIASTSSSAHPTSYGGEFVHVLSAPSTSSALEGGAINERFDTVNAAQPWGGTFTAHVNAANSLGWSLDSSGEMAGPDNITINKAPEPNALDARLLIANTSNPTPANTPPAQFSLTQRLRSKNFPSGTWSPTDFTTVDHIRGVREDSGELEVFVSVNGSEETATYEGLPTYRNLAGASTSVEASAPAPEGEDAPEPNQMAFTADVLPMGGPMVFSLVGPTRLGCTIDAASGELTVGTTPGTVTVRVSNGSRRARVFDEVELTITARPEAPPSESESETPDAGSDGNSTDAAPEEPESAPADLADDPDVNNAPVT